MPDGDRQLGDAVESGHAVGGNAKFLFQIERAAAARQLDDVRDVIDGLERGPPLSLFTRRVMCLSSIAWRKRVGMSIDELLAAQDARRCCRRRRCARFRAGPAPRR